MGRALATAAPPESSIRLPSTRTTCFEIVVRVLSTPTPVRRRSLEDRDVGKMELAVHLLDPIWIDEIALVVLHDERDFFQRLAVVGEGLTQLLEAEQVLLVSLWLTVDDEDDSVDAIEQVLAGGRLLARTRGRTDDV